MTSKVRKLARSFAKGVRNRFGRKQLSETEFKNGLYILIAFAQVRQFPEINANITSSMVAPLEIVNIVQIQQTPTCVSGLLKQGGWITLQAEENRSAFPISDVFPSEGQPHYDIAAVSVNNASKAALFQSFAETEDHTQGYTVENRWCQVSYVDADILGGFDMVVREAHAVVVCFGPGESSEDIEQILTRIARIRDDFSFPLVLLECTGKHKRLFISTPKSGDSFDFDRPWHYTIGSEQNPAGVMREAIKEHWHNKILHAIPDVAMVDPSIRLTPIPGTPESRERFAKTNLAETTVSLKDARTILPSPSWQRENSLPNFDALSMAA